MAAPAPTRAELVSPPTISGDSLAAHAGFLGQVVRHLHYQLLARLHRSLKHVDTLVNSVGDVGIDVDVYDDGGGDCSRRRCLLLPTRLLLLPARLHSRHCQRGDVVVVRHFLCYGSNCCIPLFGIRNLFRNMRRDAVVALGFVAGEAGVFLLLRLVRHVRSNVRLARHLVVIGAGSGSYLVSTSGGGGGRIGIGVGGVPLH
mmetsp:Transcript_2993/g.7277  ORF Transcript_2993/g.7277 Transcript_2993/m.7277 type:complete len:201 (-) Transcript_2993:1142-1744(-)